MSKKNFKIKFFAFFFNYLLLFNSLKTVIEPTQKKNDNRNKVNVVLKEKRELLHKVEMKNDQLKLDREIKGSA